MDEAEIIPLGTRGRPGRGSGNLKPSSAARSLAPAARMESARPMPGPHSVPESGDEEIDLVAGRADAESAVHLGEGSEPIEAPEPLTAVPDLDEDDPEDGPEDGPDDGPDEEAGDDAAEEQAESARDDRRHDHALSPDELLAAATAAAKEVFGDDADQKLAELLAFARRRLTGDFSVDDFGLDPELTSQFLLAVVRPFAETWFRIEVRGIENIPTDGSALLVSNHSGTLPLDALVTMAMVLEHSGRYLRALGADLVFKLPFIGELARKGGVTLACAEDAQRLLAEGHLVGVWPEGYKGLGKPYADRYKLQRFGRGGFVATAIRAQAPIIPVSVVGAEEIYPLVGNIPSLARLLGVPYIPITPFFPLLGVLGLIPLPSKWIIEFGEPIPTDHFDEAQADDPMVTFDVADQVREVIQQTLLRLLADRKSVFG